MAWELCSYDQLKDILDLEQALISGYPDLVVIKELVEYAIEAYLFRDLESKERSESIYINDTARSIISLRAIPITDVSSISLVSGETTLTLVENSDFLVTDYGLKLSSLASNSRLDIVYTGGYAEDAIPEAINRAAVLQTVFEFQNKDRLGAETISTQAGTVTRPALDLLPHIKQLLLNYKHKLCLI